MGRDSSVSIASRYGMDGPGSTPGRDEILRTCSDRPWSTPSLTYSTYPVIFEVKAARAWPSPPTPSSTEVKERVELYLYSTYGPSWPVLRWNFHLPLFGRGSVFEILPSGDKDWSDVRHVLIQKILQILMGFSVIMNTRRFIMFFVITNIL